MKTDDAVKNLIDKVKSDDLKPYFKTLEGTDFGLYIPVYVDGDTIKPMLTGYSQTERDLVVSVSKEPVNLPIDTKPVAWMGSLEGKDSTCTHGGTQSCSHCTSHTAACKHCSGHARGSIGNNLDAPELNYNSTVEQLINYRDLLRDVSIEGFGLSLLHGHNNEFMFTKLPDGYVSVISNGITSFRKEQELKNDETFVPNMWKLINGEIKAVGGYSLK
jgi:hypothetical protein